MSITQFMHISTMLILIITMKYIKFLVSNKYIKEHKIISYMIKQDYVNRQLMQCNAIDSHPINSRQDTILWIQTQTYTTSHAILTHMTYTLNFLCPNGIFFINSHIKSPLVTVLCLAGATTLVRLYQPSVQDICC